MHCLQGVTILKHAHDIAGPADSSDTGSAAAISLCTDTADQSLTSAPANGTNASTFAANGATKSIAADGLVAHSPAASGPAAGAASTTIEATANGPASASACPEPSHGITGEEYATEEDEYESFCDDDDLSSWGSMAEFWDADSDYYDTEEEEEALAGESEHTHAELCCCRAAKLHSLGCHMQSGQLHVSSLSRV